MKPSTSLGSSLHNRMAGTWKGSKDPMQVHSSCSRVGGEGAPKELFQTVQEGSKVLAIAASMAAKELAGQFGDTGIESDLWS